MGPGCPLSRPSPEAGIFGRWLVHASRATGKPGETSRDIYGIQPGLDSTSIPLVSSAIDEGRPSISPDGRWLLYESDATGVPEVYVHPFPNSAASLTQVSTGGGSNANQDARTLTVVR